MDWEPLTRTVDLAVGRLTLVRPGITLWLTYASPVHKLGPCVAEVLERFLAFIPPDGLDHYLASNGTYKKLTKRTLTTTLNDLRSMPKGAEFDEFHFGQGPGGGVGDYAIHFKASNLADKVTYPRETNLLLLEFPANQLDRTPPDAFADFAAGVADAAVLNSGVGGYAFRFPQMSSLRNQAMNEIARLAVRYTGLDISYDSVRYEMLGHVLNVSWLTFLGLPLVDKLGGVEAIRTGLPGGPTVRPLKQGVLVRAAEKPIIGDVNRGAADIAPLKELAALTQPVRFQTDYLGSDDPLFAERWLTRFD